jgi:SH3-like domain-containing protein
MKRYFVFFAILFCMWSVVAHAERYSVSASKVNIRSGPGTKYDWVWQAEKHYPIDVLKKRGPWYFFRDFEGDEGWIHKSLLGKIPTVITKKKICNIRSGPGTKNRIVFKVEEGISFRVLKRKGSWIHVEHADGDRGWIHKSLVW